MMKRNALLPTALTVALIGASLSGCASVDLYKPSVDQASSAAGRVEALAAAPGPYPRWSTFPDAPQNVPTQGDFAGRVSESEAVQRDLLADAGRLKWTLRRTDAFAEQSRDVIDPRLAQPAPADAAQRTAAFAEAAKALATPPPPAK